MRLNTRTVPGCFTPVSARGIGLRQPSFSLIRENVSIKLAYTSMNCFSIAF